MKQGIYKSTELSNEDYHADPAISSSGIMRFKECPALYHSDYLDPESPPRKTSNAMQFGSAAHLYLLENDLFFDNYAVLGNESIDKKVSREWKLFKKECEENNKTPLLHSEYKKLQGMAQATQQNELATKILEKALFEMSFFAEDPSTGLMLKARPDILTVVPGIGNVIVDYKVTGISLNAKKQSDHAFGLNRYIQAYHHSKVTELATGGKISNIIYLTQMDVYPFLIRIFRMTEEHLEIGKEECEQHIQDMNQCIKTGEWPGYPQGIVDYEAPAWWHFQYN